MYHIRDNSCSDCIEALNLLEMLKTRATLYEQICNRNNVNPTVFIWVKKFGNAFYPKIEFDVGEQELQYDMNLDGTINEVHFKSFEKENNKWVRKDFIKEEANPVARAIDELINPNS